MSSNNVDNRVVNMEFNNAQFESGISQTLSSLDKLKQSLQFNNATNGLEKVQNAVSGFSLSTIESSVASLENRFSTLGIVGMTAIQNITNKVMNLGTTLATKVISQIKEGGTLRYQNIAQAKFMIEGLGKDWNALYEDMDYAVTGTAYGIDEAAKAASSLSASGIEAGEDMKTALRGISGVAAMTNSDYSTMADVFTTVAGQGKLMTMQLRQLEGRGLNAAATLAKYLNTTEAAVRDMVTNGSIDFETFSKAMDDAFGEHATKANDTFSGALANMKAALSRIGENFARPVYERLIGPLNDVREVIDKAKKKLTELTGSLSGGNWYNSPFGTFIGALSNKLRLLIKNTDLSWFDTLVDYMIEASKFGTYFVQNYDGVINTIKNFVDAQDGISVDKYKTIMNILTGLSNIGKAIKNVFNSVSLIFQTIVAAFKQVFNLGDASDGFLTLTEVLLKLSEALIVTEDDANKLKPVFVDIFTVVKSVIDGIISLASTLSEYFGPIVSKLFEYMMNFYNSGSKVINTLSSFIDKNELLSGILNTVKNAFKTSTSIVDAFEKTFSGVIDILKNISPKTWGIAALAFVLTNLIKNFSVFAFAFKRVTSLVNNVAMFGNTFSNIFKGLAYYTRSVAQVAVIKEIAIAIVALAAALALLTLVDSDKLVTATKCMAALIAVIAGFGVILTVMASNMSNIVKVSFYFTALSTAILSLSVAMLIMAAAMAKLGSINTNGIWKTFAVMSAILAELLASVIILSILAPTLSTGTIALVFYASAIYILVKAFTELSKIDLKGIEDKLVALGLTMLALIGLSNLALSVNFAAPFGLLAMIASIWLVEKMLKYIISEGVDFKALKENLDKIAIAVLSIISIALIMKIIDTGRSGMVKAGMSMVLIATSLYIVASALKSLTDIGDMNKLDAAIDALAMIFLGFIGILGILANAKIASRAGGTLLLMSASILVITKAIRQLTEIDDTDKLWNAFAIISLMLIDILATLSIMSSLVKHVKVSALLSMAVLISAISLSLSVLARMDDASNAISAAGAIGIVLIALTASIIALSKFTRTFDITALSSLSIMLLLLITIAASLTILSTTGDMGKVYDSVAAISLVLAVLSAAMVAITRYSKSMMPNALMVFETMILSLIAISTSLVLLTQYGDMGKVYDAVIAISLVLAVLSTAFIAISAFSKVITTSSVIALGVMILALVSVAASLKLLLDGNYNWDDMKAAVISMIAVLGSVVVALGLLSIISSLTGNIGMIIAAASLVAVLLTLTVVMKSFAKLINTFTKSLKSLTQIDYKKIDIKTLTSLALLIVKIGLASTLAGAGLVLLGVGLVAVGVGLGIIAVSFTLITLLVENFAASIDILVKALISLGEEGDSIGTGIKTIADSVKYSIASIGSSLAEGFVSFITTLATKSLMIKTSIKVLIGSIISLIFETINTINTYIADGLIKLLTTIDEKLPTLLELILSIMVTVLKGIAAYSATFGYYGAIIAGYFLYGLAEGFVEISPYLGETLADVIEGLIKMLDSMLDRLLPDIKLKIYDFYLEMAEVLYGLLVMTAPLSAYGTAARSSNEASYQEIVKEREELAKQLGKTEGEAYDKGVAEGISEGKEELTKSTDKTVKEATDATDAIEEGTKQYGNRFEKSAGESLGSGLSNVKNTVTNGVKDMFDIDLSAEGFNMIDTFFKGSDEAAEENIIDLSGLPSDIAAQMRKDYEAEGYVFEDQGKTIGKKIEDGANDYSPNFDELQDNVVNNISPDEEELVSTGNSDLDQYINGMTNLSDEQIQKLREAGARIGYTIHVGNTDYLEIESPSKKAIEAAGYYGQGMCIGLNNSVVSVARAAMNLAKSVTDPINNALSNSQKYSSDYILSPTVSPVIDSETMDKFNTISTSLFGNDTSLRLATDSAISVNNTSQATLAAQVQNLSDQVKKLADTDYSKILEGVAINVDASTNVDGTPLKRMASKYTVKQINDQVESYTMALGGRA